MPLIHKEQVEVRVEEKERAAKIRKGVRQGCSLSPLVFNIYIEEAVKEIKEKLGTGITYHGERIGMLRLGDDIVLFAENKVDLENVLSRMEKLLGAEYGLKINKTKTKAMKASRSENRDPLNIKIGNEPIKEVDEFFLLGQYYKKGWTK